MKLIKKLQKKLRDWWQRMTLMAAEAIGFELIKGRLVVAGYN